MRARCTARLRARLLLAAAIALAVPTARARAQSPTQAEARIRQEREELDRVRREREALRQRMTELQNTVHSLADEVANLDRQAATTNELVGALGRQLSEINGEVTTATANLQRAEGELADKQRTLQRRVVAIYKRGPLYSYEALLSAQSIAELVARYKYLHLLALRDRALVRNVAALRDHITQQRQFLVRLENDLEESRQEKESEEQKLRQLQQQRGQSLVVARQQERQTGQRLAEIERTEGRLRDVIGSLEIARRRAEAAAASRPRAGAVAAVPSTPSTIRTSDLGKLDWPVDGTVLYRFGRVVNPNNTTTRWNGIGIAAAAGTPVRAIAPGEVAMVRQMGTYGLTVIVQHGGGDYSVYGSLRNADVREGQPVRKGQDIGSVGASDPDLPAHLHFEIRRSRGVAVDPLEWLRGSAR